MLWYAGAKLMRCFLFILEKWQKQDIRRASFMPLTCRTQWPDDAVNGQPYPIMSTPLHTIDWSILPRHVSKIWNQTIGNVARRTE